LSTAPAIAVLHRRRQTNPPPLSNAGRRRTPSRRQTPSNTVATIDKHTCSPPLSSITTVKRRL
jgi:hypothetical protein